jgi:hypothetical protein
VFSVVFSPKRHRSQEKKRRLDVSLFDMGQHTFDQFLLEPYVVREETASVDIAAAGQEEIIIIIIIKTDFLVNCIQHVIENLAIQIKYEQFAGGLIHED